MRKNGIGFGIAVGIAVGCSGTVTEVTRTAEPTLEATLSSVDADGVSVTVTARNTEAHAIRYETRVPCGVTLVFYREAGPSDAPAWSQLNWLNDQAGGCKWLPQEVTLQPGETRPSMVRAQVQDVLGDSLPEGRYRVAGVVAVAAPSLRLAEVEAGEAELAR